MAVIKTDHNNSLWDVFNPEGHFNIRISFPERDCLTISLVFRNKLGGQYMIPKPCRKGHATLLLPSSLFEKPILPTFD